ncbi:ABC transporter ATP-binding protein [Curtobacterium sp. 9128]|uniref:ABC transporter ATP-binding protein n=1 Tax=Curtobacterium sp. 9128 TaxID=1793722 RepID=UPI0016434CF7|nr:ABC transporter ATP-binding protein [Curtobacterium sp. 9128]
MTMNAVSVQGLTKQRDAFALRDVTMTVPSGYVTGLVGPNGAGKTSLLKSMLGLLTPDAGTVQVLGGDPAAHPGARDRVGVVLDRVTAAPEWRVGTIGRRIGRLYAHWDESTWRDLLDRFGLPVGNRVDALSRGQTVKLSLAMALAHDPDLLVLDEPTSGLDPVARRELADLIREYMTDPGHSVLFSTHITAELDDLADHIVVLNAGRVVFAGMLDELHDRFAVVRSSTPITPGVRTAAIGARTGPSGGYEALIRTDDTAAFGSDVVIDQATTDDVVVHFAEEARK